MARKKLFEEIYLDGLASAPAAAQTVHTNTQKVLPQYIAFGQNGEEAYIQNAVTQPQREQAAAPQGTTPAAPPQQAAPQSQDTPSYIERLQSTYSPVSYTAPRYTMPAAPAYQGSSWDSVADKAIQELMNMTYSDWAKGEDYAALADRYSAQGQRAVQDVLGQYAARTGGVASSYAVSAAQQQYNQYMEQLESIAREMYENERGNRMDAAQLAQGMAQNDYDRYRDQLSQYNTDRNFGYNVFADEVNLDRQMEQEAYDRQRAEDNEAYDRQRTDRNDAMNRVADFMQAGGSAADLPPELLEAAGYSNAELDALQSYYGPGGLTAEDAEMLAYLFGGNRNLSPEDWETALATIKDFGGTEDWLVDNQFYKDPGVMANEDYAAAAAELEGTGKENDLMTLAQWQNSPLATQFASYQEYIAAYLEWAKEKENK